MINKISNANLLINSFFETKKCSDWKNSVQLYEANLLKNIRKTQRELRTKSYKQADFYSFFLSERGKTRYVRSITFYDRVIQRALCSIINPIIYPYLIHDNGASVKGKGVAFTRKRFENHIHNYYRKNGNDGYILLIDFSKFYDNIEHKKLIDMYKKVIDDNDIISLIYHLIDSFSVDISHYEYNDNMPFDSFQYAKLNPLKTKNKFMNKSLGIGSQISQISGIYYPTKIDNYCKIVKGIKYYGRYMDDSYIISNNKYELKSLLVELEDVCKELGIYINHKKTQIFKLNRGFVFLKIKYILTDFGHLVRIPVRENFIRERKKLKSFRRMLDDGILKPNDIDMQYKSWRGNLVKYDCHISLRNMDMLYYKLFKDAIYDRFI